MTKPDLHKLYDQQVTEDCERVLVSLLRGLGPWKNSVFLVGGLAPRYIVKARPPVVPPHAGTGDVDIVVDLAILANTEAYRTLEENLKKLGFERGENSAGVKVNWRWQVSTPRGTRVLLEFLVDDPDTKGGRPRVLPTEGNVSALTIPHASIVFDLHDKINVTAELLGENGKVTETIAFANRVSFVCLKAFAFDDRAERKDAHDLVYCLENAPGGVQAAIVDFKTAMAGKHRDVIVKALEKLRARFCSDETSEGHLKDGPVAVAKFEIEGDEDADREARVLRQRNASETVRQLVDGLSEV